jgi:hypothetical protein
VLRFGFGQIKRQTERAETLNERPFQLVVGGRIKLAGRANLFPLDLVAAQHAHFPDCGDRSAVPMAFHVTLANLFG